MNSSIIRTIVLVAVTALTGCASDLAVKQEAPAFRGPVTKKVTGPYDAAKSCVAHIDGVAGITIGVGTILDRTGKMNIQQEGTGSFVPQDVGPMVASALADMNVRVIELSTPYKQTIDWFAQKGAHSLVVRPHHVVFGSVTALDFGTFGEVAELSVFGVGPRARQYRATGRMDLRLTKMPYQEQPGGMVEVSTAFMKEFVAVETGFGAAKFIAENGGAGFASFNIGSNQREPMQLTLGYMADYGATSLVIGLLKKSRRTVHAAVACEDLLNDPYGESSKTVQEASAD